MIRKKTPFFVTVLILSFMLTGCLPTEETPLAPPVMRASDVQAPQTAAVQRDDLVSTSRVTLSYKPLSEVTYYFQTSGKFIDMLHVQLGDEITAGQLLAELDRSDLADALAEAEYDVKQAELSSRRTGYSAASAKLLEIAKLKLSDLKEQEALRYIYSENGGKVTYIRSYDPTSLSDTQDAVVIVSDRSEAAYSVNTQGLELITAGQTYELDIGGVLYPSEAVADESGGIMFYPEIDISAASTSAYITVETGRSDDALYVPAKAVKEVNDGYVVYMLNDAGLRESVTVEIGLLVGGRWEILSGLEEGDEIIVE